MRDETAATYALARAACPEATVRCYKLTEGGGNVIETSIIKVRLTGTNIKGEVKTQGTTPEQATEGLKHQWAKARRAYETDRVISDCRRLSEGNLDEDMQSVLEQDLLRANSYAFENIAARARKSAQALADSHSQAA